MRLNESETMNDRLLKFDGTNYAEWSGQLRFRLMEKGLWSHITDAPLKPQSYEEEGVWKTETADSQRYKSRVTSEVKLDDQKALGIIGRSLKSDYLESIGRAETAAEAWIALQEIYENNSAGSLLACLSVRVLQVGDGGNRGRGLVSGEAGENSATMQKHKSAHK